jgi:hypothetical protein
VIKGVNSKPLQMQLAMSLPIQSLPFSLSHANASRIPLKRCIYPSTAETTPPVVSLLECNPIHNSLQ